MGEPSRACGGGGRERERLLRRFLSIVSEFVSSGSPRDLFFEADVSIIVESCRSSALFEALLKRSGAECFETGRFEGSGTIGVEEGRGERLAKGDVARGDIDADKLGVMIEVVALLDPRLVIELPLRSPDPPPNTSRAALRRPDRGRDRDLAALVA